MATFLATLSQIIALVRKELLALIKEPASRALLIVPAFLQALLYGYGATYDLTHVPYAVLDQSRSAVSTELLARLDGTDHPLAPAQPRVPPGRWQVRREVAGILDGHGGRTPLRARRVMDHAGRIAAGPASSSRGAKWPCRGVLPRLTGVPEQYRRRAHVRAHAEP